ncbi:ABC transporter permease subunit, partial [Streptococcus equi subsp. zooepidemicus]|nr:ABC transporter permease subunit [Streptococcus equi subsp. zooepidemicus]
GLRRCQRGSWRLLYSLGIRPKHAMRYVILPQAFKNILPALGNELITIIKDSALLQTIGVMELWNGALGCDGDLSAYYALAVCGLLLLDDNNNIVAIIRAAWSAS